MSSEVPGEKREDAVRGGRAPDWRGPTVGEHGSASGFVIATVFLVIAVFAAVALVVFGPHEGAAEGGHDAAQPVLSRPDQS